MSDELRPTFFARLARRPFPIFLGCALGFVACCIAGRVAARQQPFQNFVRFHIFIAPEAHYYPTFSQTLNLARQHAQPGKMLVIVGGNSVLYGYGQRATHMWTARLQELLGDDFVVLNLAMRGQWANEFGGLIAERLAADGVPVVYVTMGTENVGWDCDWDGGLHCNFFWDASGKGFVPPDPRRDEWLENGFYTRFAKTESDPAASRAQAARKEQALERRRRGSVDGATYAHDLWTYVANRYRSTVWTPLKYPNFWKPHRAYEDPEPGALLPWETYNNPSQEPAELRNLRGVYTSEAAKQLREGKGYDAVGEQFQKYLPDVLRARTLYLLRLEGTYFRNRLAPDERAQYEETYRRYRDAVRRAGLNILLVGEAYDERDFFDRSHFSEKGGRKLAEDLAPTVRAMSARLYGTK